MKHDKWLITGGNRQRSTDESNMSFQNHLGYQTIFLRSADDFSETTGIEANSRRGTMTDHERTSNYGISKERGESL